MFKKSVLFVSLIALVGAGAPAPVYDFWGITLGTQTYNGSTCLSFTGVSGSGAQAVVGAYPYTSVDGTWQGPFAAASPGVGFLASQKSDAQGLFFRADSQYAYFTLICGTPQTGYAAAECGTGTRLFGPGDLKIDIGGDTYGVGMRLSGLPWNIDPTTTAANLQIYKAAGGTDSLNARDAGTLGDVELDPSWDRAGNQDLAPGSDAASAFFVSGSGAHTGAASVSCDYTGISIGGAGVYAYEVTVPWTAFGTDSGNTSLTASWRPDCGNDIISSGFSRPVTVGAVPEPTSIVSLVGGVVAMFATRKTGLTSQ